MPRLPMIVNSLPDTELSKVAEDSKDPQKPDNHYDDHNTIYYPFDLALHGDITVKQPQQDSDDHQSEHYIDKRHMEPS
jgi:hypothetical protein